jgi:hypothetical protein
MSARDGCGVEKIQESEDLNWSSRIDCASVRQLGYQVMAANHSYQVQIEPGKISRYFRFEFVWVELVAN